MTQRSAECVYASPWSPERVVCTCKKLIHNGVVPTRVCDRCPFFERRERDFFSQTHHLMVRQPPVSRVLPCMACPDAAPAVHVTRKRPRPVAFVDLSTAVRHLTYHVWPTLRNDCWRWNLAQLAERWSLFNGRKVLGVAYDYRSEFPDIAKAESLRLGMDWDAIHVRRNTAKLGEVKTWLLRLSDLQPDTAKENEVVFAAHAKGVRHAPDVMIPWVSTMYECCLDDWDTVRQQLEYAMFSGPFQQVRDGHRWHYSGSFYWFRLQDVARRNWRNIEGHYSGTETFPWLMADRSETGCLFATDCGDLYTTQGQLRQQWEAERHARSGKGIRGAVGAS